VQAFTQLVAMAISNTETHVEVARLAEEQAALRRVATLVAEGAGPTAVFDAVAAEIERLLDAEGLQLSRYESDDELSLRRGRAARLLKAGDEARRRVVRDLHDGAQQRFVHAIVALTLAHQALDGVDTVAASLVAEALEQAESGTAAVEGGVFRVEVRDDGLGGVDPDGHGLTGLRDRATALGGRLDVESPPSGGTIVAATLPLPDA